MFHRTGDTNALTIAHYVLSLQFISARDNELPIIINTRICYPDILWLTYFSDNRQNKQEQRKHETQNVKI